MTFDARKELLERFGGNDLNLSNVKEIPPLTSPLVDKLAVETQLAFEGVWNELKGEDQEAIRQRLLDRIKEQTYKQFQDTNYEEAVSAGSMGATELVAEGSVLNHIGETEAFEKGKVYRINLGSNGAV